MTVEVTSLWDKEQELYLKVMYVCSTTHQVDGIVWSFLHVMSSFWCCYLQQLLQSVDALNSLKS